MCGAAATLLTAAPASAQQDRISATEKGSLCIWSKIEIRWDAAGFLIQDTFLNLTNDYPEDVRVQLYFINGDPPLAADLATGERAHPGWNYYDNEIVLTANEPTVWSAMTGQPKGLSPFSSTLDPGFPPGRPDPESAVGERMMRGWALGWAVNSDNEEIRWNHLAGNATLVNYLLSTAWEYNTWNSQVVAGTAANNGATVASLVPGYVAGSIALDGVAYAQPFDQLLINFPAVDSIIYSGPRLVTADVDLTLHPVSADLRQETDGPITTKAHFDVWNMNEVKFSGAYRCITCWDQTLLRNYGIPNHFLLGNLQTAVGKARIDGQRSFLCDVDFDPANNNFFPFPPGPGDAIDPRDVVSEDAAILGVIAKHLTFDGGLAFAAAGTNVYGMGVESALIQYDTLAAPPETPVTETTI